MHHRDLGFRGLGCPGARALVEIWDSAKKSDEHCARRERGVSTARIPGLKRPGVSMNTVKKIIRPASLLIAALIGLSAAACQESEMRIERVCKRHCSAMEDCNNNDYDNCMNTCVETANECDSDSDRDMALDKLDECQKEECGNVLACGVDAWVECKL
jgi:hypothetical protein